jgi:hypothetical protein
LRISGVISFGPVDEKKAMTGATTFPISVEPLIYATGDLKR